MNAKLEVLKFLSSKGILVVAHSKSKDVSCRDYLIFSNTGRFLVYNLDFSLDEVVSIEVNDNDDVVICVK